MLRRQVLGFIVLMAACNVSGPNLDRVPVGTWGGDNAGLLVSETSAHVHIACTVGEIPQPIPLDTAGRFDVEGRHNVDAFPINRGIDHPARFTGWTDGRKLSLGVRLTDTGETLGPVTLFLGRAPKMQNCPICRR